MKSRVSNIDDNLFCKYIKPISINNFKSDIFFKKPYLIRGDSGKFSAIPKSSQVLKLAEGCNIRAVFSQLKQAKIDATDASDMFASGATICITGLEHTSKEFRRLAEDARISVGFSGTTSIRAYISPEQKGFDDHYDPRAVSVIQLEGEKTWWYSEKAAAICPFDSSGYPLSEIENASLKSSNILSATLTPGDMLFLPPGHWHRANAITKSFALNLGFDYIGESKAEIVSRAILNQLLKIPEFRQPLFDIDLDKPSCSEFVDSKEFSTIVDFIREL